MIPQIRIRYDEPIHINLWLLLRAVEYKNLMCKSKVEGALPPHLKSWVGTCPHCPHGSYATAFVYKKMCSWNTFLSYSWSMDILQFTDIPLIIQVGNYFFKEIREASSAKTPTVRRRVLLSVRRCGSVELYRAQTVTGTVHHRPGPEGEPAVWPAACPPPAVGQTPRVSGIIQGIHMYRAQTVTGTAHHRPVAEKEPDHHTAPDIMATSIVTSHYWHCL